MKIRIGVVSSSGGSAWIAATACLEAAGYELEPIVISDRKCGMSDWAANRGFPVFVLPYDSAEDFSAAALNIFLEYGCKDILLFYTRRVAAPLIDTLNVWNIHPALLPAFVGLNAVQQALDAKVRLFGATLHRVDKNLDTGPIVAQVAATLPPDISGPRAQRLSYIQKVWLTLIWFEQISTPDGLASAVTSLGPGLDVSSSDLLDSHLKKSLLEWLRILEPEETAKCKL